jgi:hypothetical protein
MKKFNRIEKKKKKFEPNREYINNAVKEFLSRGGKIKTVTLPEYEPVMRYIPNNFMRE